MVLEVAVENGCRHTTTTERIQDGKQLMGRVIHSINTTVGGLCHHLDNAVDDAHHRYATELTLSADALVLGRNTFDLFMDFWPSAVNRTDLPIEVVGLANAFNNIPKLVVSSRPIETTWNNTKHIPGPDLEELRQKLETLQGNVVIFGSPGLASSLLNEGLVDELHILAQPMIGIEGPQAFNNIRQRTNLTLVAADPLESGSVLLRYEVA